MAESWPLIFRWADTGARLHLTAAEPGIYRSVDIPGRWRLAAPGERTPEPVDAEARAYEQGRLARARAAAS